MANKVAIQGVVQQVSQSGFKLDDKWFNKANKADDYTSPSTGDTVKFDAYGQESNLVYRVKVEGNGNGQSGPNGVHSAQHVHASSAAAVAGNGSGAGIGGSRPTALMAAATLMQGSDGTVADIVANTLAVASAFESYLSGKSTDEELPL